jgi:hypothetical protein
MRFHAPHRALAPATRRTTRLLASTLLLASGAAGADSVIDWTIVSGQVQPAYGAPPSRAYLAAMVQLSVHDALNSITPRYESYNVIPLANPGADPDAAVAAAAHDVLIHELSRAPDSAGKIAARALVETAYANALGAIPDGAAESQGVAAGQAAAAAMILRRTNDGSATRDLPYTLGPGVGVYQPTPPAFLAPQFAGFALMPTFVINSPSQFRADPAEILDTTSDAYARDYNEVKRLGNTVTRSAAPDSEESKIARFFPGGGADWEAVARTIVQGLGMDRWEHARLFALIDASSADGAMSFYDTKYTYNFWRPVTAIRWADDGNPATEPDPTWSSYIVTPPYPDYTCGLPTIAGASTEVMRRVFGSDEVPYTFTAAGVTRHYDRLSQAAQEAADARVYGGIHFRTGCEMGVRMGEKIGRFVVLHALKPLKTKHDHVMKPNLADAAPVSMPAPARSAEAAATARRDARTGAAATRRGLQR